MALIPTSTAIVQSFAGALYGKQIGSVTMKAVSSDINSLGLNTTLNSYFSYSFGTMTAAQVADMMVTNLGIVDGKANAVAYVVGQLNAAKPAVWGQTLSGILTAFSSLTADATYGAAATAWNTKVEAAAAYTGAADVSISEIVSVFPLTTSLTDVVVGSSGSDTINAFDGFLGLKSDGTPVYLNTLNGSDVIDGGAGNDTINVSTTIAAAYTLPTSVTVKNVETLNLQTDAQVITKADVSTWTGLQTVNVKMTGTAAALTDLTTKGNVTSVTVTNVASAGITDSVDPLVVGLPAADTLATVTATGVAGLTTVTSDAAKTINLTSSNGGATVVATAPLAGRSIAFNLSKVTAGTLTDTTATAVAVDSNGLATGATGNTVAALTTAAAKTVSLTGASPLTITADTLDSKVVITSTNTGGVTLTQALTANQQFIGASSSGNDTIEVATAFTTAITTGAGNDKVTYGGPAGTGGSIDAGDGADTIVMTPAIAATATASTTFAGTVSGFEVLELSAATGAATAIDMANADGINYLTVNGVASGNALTVTNAAADFTIKQKALTAAASSIALKDATGTADNVNFVYSAADGFADTAATTVNGVESVKVTFVDANATIDTTAYTASIAGDAIKTVTLSGVATATFTNTSTTITSLDASGLAGILSGAPTVVKGLTWTTGAFAADATVKGSALGDNTINFSATTGKAVTYTGGAAVDTITIGANTKNNSFALGGGDNVLSAGSATGNNTVTLSSDKTAANSTGSAGNKIVLGNGNNTVTDTGTKGAYVELGTGANTVTLGTGNDFVKVAGASAGANVIDISAGGNDTIVFSGPAVAAGYYTTITGFGTGDKLDVAALTANASTVTPLGAKISLGGAASFANYLDAATATDLSALNTASAATIKWFQYAGNTYVVVDDVRMATVDATGSGNDSVDTVTFQDGIDSVICLTGLVDLSASTVASDVITYVAVA